MKCKHGEFDPAVGCPECIAERRAAEAAPRGIVKVRYGAEATEGREYSYYTEEPLQVGDLVEVPLKAGNCKARVTATGVDPAEVAAFKDAMRTIPAGSLIDAPTPPGLYPEKEEAPADSHGDYYKAPADLEAMVNHALDPETPIPAEEFVAEPAPELELPLPAPGGNQTAMVRVAPEKDDKVQALYNEGLDLLRLAEGRVIKSDADVKLATDDLAVIAGVIKKLDELKREYEAPIKEHLEAFRATFKAFIEPLVLADKLNRDKWTAYRAAVKEAARKAEETNRMAEEVARRQAEASGTGEIEVDLTPVEAPHTADTVRSSISTGSVYQTPKHRIVDFKALPDEYKLPDAGKLTRVIKAAKGQIEIAGVEIYFDDVTSVRLR